MHKVAKISFHIFAISPEKRGDEFDVLPGDNTNVFQKLIVSLGVCVARHAHRTQNIKSAISLQYLKEKVKDEADILPANEY